MKVGELVVHTRGTIYPHRYLLGIVLRKAWGTGSFEKLFDVLWFHSGKKQLIREANLVPLADFHSNQ